MATSLFVSGSVKRWRFGRSTDARDRDLPNVPKPNSSMNSELKLCNFLYSFTRNLKLTHALTLYYRFQLLYRHFPNDIAVRPGKWPVFV